MIARSMASKAALGVAAAGALLTTLAPPAGAVVAPEAGGVSSANAAESAMVSAIWLTKFDLIAQGETNKATVNVPTAGRYVVQYQVSAPETDALLGTVVDGKKITDLAVPAAPGTYATFGETVSFQLTAGKHTFAMTGLKIPQTGDPGTDTYGTASGVLLTAR
jgi:hypothetical protein